MAQEPDYQTARTTCKQVQCQRPAWLSCRDGMCLFHSPHNGQSIAAARLVWEEAREKAAAGGEQTDQAIVAAGGANTIDFKGWHFPADPDANRCPNEHGPRGAFVETCFQGYACFIQATFDGTPWFDGAVFERGATFGDCTFNADACFTGAKCKGEFFFAGMCLSHKASVTFSEASFNNDAHFTGTEFGRAAIFSKCRFQKQAQFGACQFAECWFTQSRFEFVGVFRGAAFSNSASFEDIKFKKGADFYNATFGETASFERSVFGTGTDIALDDKGAFTQRRHGESAYRLAKQAADERGDYAAAGRYHYAEQCAIEDARWHESGHRPWRKAFWLWLGRFVFGRMVFGYGERPWHPLLVGLLVIVLCAGLYCHGSAIVANEPGLSAAARTAYQANLPECLHFSVVTFTTLGYGDFQPKPPWRWLADAEAFVGAALLATFVVCLTRKYMR